MKEAERGRERQREAERGRERQREAEKAVALRGHTDGKTSIFKISSGCHKPGTGSKRVGESNSKL